MKRLEVRLFGGFDVRDEEHHLSGFESQKVRALLAYLVCHRRRELSRDILADLLWPELSESDGRRNLRQALYNLRSALENKTAQSKKPKTPPPLVTTRETVRLHGSLDCWCDVEAFEQAVQAARQSDADNAPKQLAGAVQLYRGDFLAGFFVKGSSGFEEWLTAEQERLRESAIESLQTLVEHYLETGSYSLGVQYAWRLVNLDPLSEQAHRQLIRLYALTGRRERALAQYEECRRLLYEELGVEPREVTSNLHRWIELQEQVEPRPPVIPPSQYPQIGLLGREEELDTLLSWWQSGDAESGLRVLLVEGESGVGKTRLVEELVDRLRRQQRVNLLRGRATHDNAPAGSRPFEDALHNALLAQTGYVRRALAELSPATLTELGGIFPDLRRQRPDLPPRLEDGLTDTLYAAIVGLLRELSGPFETGQKRIPLILFLDDLHLAGGDTFLLLEHVARRHPEIPLCVIGCHLPEGANARGPIATLCGRLEDLGVETKRLRLGSLDPSDLRRLQQDLIEAGSAHRLAQYLERLTGGLPVALVELLFDRYEANDLRYRSDGRWRWAGDAELRSDQAPLALDDLIWGRVERLPRSARRLLTLAAVVGLRFDAELLARVESEDISVVWANLRIWIERHMVRTVDDPWAEVERYPSPNPSDSTELRAPLEFCHRRLRTVIYRRLPPNRRMALHGQVARELESRGSHDDSAWVEPLAYHFTAAEQWEPALRYHLRAAELAVRHPAPMRALLHYGRALALLEQGAFSDHQRREIGQAVERGRKRIADLMLPDELPFFRTPSLDGGS